MSEEQHSEAWYTGYEAYMNDGEYSSNPYNSEESQFSTKPGKDKEQFDWADGYLEAQYEVEAAFGEDDVA